MAPSGRNTILGHSLRIEHMVRQPGMDSSVLTLVIRPSALEHARYRVVVGVHHQGSTSRYCQRGA